MLCMFGQLRISFTSAAASHVSFPCSSLACFPPSVRSVPSHCNSAPASVHAHCDRAPATYVMQQSTNFACFGSLRASGPSHLLLMFHSSVQHHLNCVILLYSRVFQHLLQPISLRDLKHTCTRP